ncbi:hypothetical protein F5X68DRAFT_247526, partial [Plectosphaerella plurivora]
GQSIRRLHSFFDLWQNSLFYLLHSICTIDAGSVETTIMKNIQNTLWLSVAALIPFTLAAPSSRHLPSQLSHQEALEARSDDHLGHIHDRTGGYVDHTGHHNHAREGYCVICSGGPDTSKWSEDRCKIYFDQYGFRNEYIVNCKEFFARQYPGDWTEEDCKVYYDQWKAELDQPQSHPEYDAKCSKYHQKHCDDGCGQHVAVIEVWTDARCAGYWDKNATVIHTGEYLEHCKLWHEKNRAPQECDGCNEPWSDDRCKTYWDAHSSEGFVGDYALRCKVWHQRHIGCTENCTWPDDKCKVYWDHYSQDGFKGDFAIYCKAWYDKNGCTDGCQRGATGNWTDDKCQAWWNANSTAGVTGDYAIYCKDFHQKNYACDGGCDNKTPKPPVKWTDDKCKAYWDANSAAGVTGDYATYCKEYHDRTYGKKDKDQVNCKDAQYRNHQSCIVVVSGATMTHSIATGLAVAALTMFAFL